MPTVRGHCVASRHPPMANGTHVGRGASFLRPGARCSLVAAAVAMTLVSAPAASADATATLQAQIAEERSGCQPLQLDPVLVGVAQRANHESQMYKDHNARFYPFEDPMPILKNLGYPATKAKLLTGYGDVEAKAMQGVVLFGWESISDCSYTKYAVDVLDGGSYTLATAIFANA